MREQTIHRFGSPPRLRDLAGALLKRGSSVVATVVLVSVGAVLSGCGGTDPISPQVVVGVAATGAPLAGQVSLRDSSTASKEKSTVIGGDGSFAIDVTDMKAPFMLKATGVVDGVSRTMYSFASGPGVANINPLSSAAVASAAGIDNPAAVYEGADEATMERVRLALPMNVEALQTQLKPLLDVFSAAGTNPVTGDYKADHQGLDGVFDNVKVVVTDGILTITNAETGAVLFTAPASNVRKGRFTDHDDDIPRNGSRLAAPTEVQAVGGDAQVTISWAPVTNATSYTISWSTKAAVTTEEDEHHAQAISNATSPYVQTGLATGATYYYVVRAVKDGRRGYASAEVSATTSSTTPVVSIPAAPINVSATGGTRQTTVSWAAVTGATSYNLYWSNTTGVTTLTGRLIAGATSPAVLTGLADSTPFFYIVTAVNSAGESTPSVQVAATTLAAAPPPPAVPTAPTSVVATGGDNQVTLSWAPVDGAASYNVYRAGTSGVTTGSTKFSGVSSPLIQSGLGASSTYFYIVTAVNASGESGASAQVAATTNPPAAVVPPAPTGVAATGGTKQVSVSWNVVGTATSYNVYGSTTSGFTPGPANRLTTGATSLSYVHTGLADSTTYYYKVTAVNTTGEGPASGQASAATSTPAPVIDGAGLYTTYCSSCHDPLGSSAYQGASAALIKSGIANVGTMRTKFNAATGTLIKLTDAQIDAISAALQ